VTYYYDNMRMAHTFRLGFAPVYDKNNPPLTVQAQKLQASVEFAIDMNSDTMRSLLDIMRDEGFTAWTRQRPIIQGVWSDADDQ